MCDKFTKDDIIIHRTNGFISHAWLNDGRYAIHVTTEEKSMSNEEFCKIIEDERANGIFRCLDCNTKMDSLGHFHLFAAHLCDKCHQKREELAVQERSRGHVCSFCGKPYSKCYC